jgi:hypothetical protein
MLIDSWQAHGGKLKKVSEKTEERKQLFIVF